MSYWVLLAEEEAVLQLEGGGGHLYTQSGTGVGSGQQVSVDLSLINMIAFNIFIVMVYMLW